MLDEPDRHSGAHLDDPTHIATCLRAKTAITGGVPQGAFSDRTMKAATCVPARVACAAFHFQPNAIKSAVGFGLINALRLTGTGRIGQAQADVHRSSKSTHILSDKYECHATKQNRTLITVGFCVGCFHCLVNWSTTARLSFRRQVRMVILHHASWLTLLIFCIPNGNF